MLLAVAMNRWVAVRAFGVLASGAAASDCSSGYYSPSVPRIVTQDSIVARVEGLREETTRHAHHLAVDATVRSVEPLRITTARLTPRSAASCEGGIEASAIDDGLGSTWDRWSRVPLAIPAERRLHVVFDGNEPSQKIITEPSELDLAFSQGQKVSCLRVHLVGPEPELAWRTDARVLMVGGLRYDAFFGAPSGIHGLLFDSDRGRRGSR